MSTVLQVIIAIVGAIVVPEIYAAIPRLAAWLIKREAAKLPTHLRADCEEEWLQGNAEHYGSVWQLVDALSFFVCGSARKTARDALVDELHTLDFQLDSLRGVLTRNLTTLSELPRHSRPDLGTRRGRTP
jgi:hypothetical protein